MSTTFDRGVLADLEETLAASDLPGKARDYGKRLLARLRVPLRLVVTGPAGSGKSELARLLCGHAAPTVVTGPGEPSETPSALFCNLVVIELGLPSPGGGFQSAGAIEQTSPDIILWCTQGFAHDEAQIWARVPDNLKDHAFLVLTRADELMCMGVLEERLDDLREVVETEFHSLLPIATAQAAAAMASTETADRALLARSGATALFEALSRMIEQGRSADLDAASLFVRRHSQAALHTRPQTRPLDAPPGMAPVEMTNRNGRAEMPQNGATDAPACAPALPDPEVVASARAIRLLDGHSGDFPDAIGENDPAEIEGLLALCARTTEELGEIIEDAGLVGDLAEDILEANEMLLLLTLEQDETAAADAVTLLLQLRRGFEARLAA
ncbi:hypothetical protein [Rhodovulum steppense]|uniref:Uncharacterized protein n=1 Tax=Rhodovulum steppense TaxID=540251 RepID=A0A4R1Z396_9RHOB|nr:hypothetical protein [Rhodovulum steppense]TCM88162.1 hypothetical protein EV216_101175 [Rhodovulum steppense]